MQLKLCFPKVSYLAHLSNTTASGEFRSLHMPGRVLGGGASFQNRPERHMFVVSICVYHAAGEVSDFRKFLHSKLILTEIKAIYRESPSDKMLAEMFCSE
jgi:hypothetical protein